MAILKYYITILNVIQFSFLFFFNPRSFVRQMLKVLISISVLYCKWQDQTRKQNVYALFRCTKSDTKAQPHGNNQLEKNTQNHVSNCIRHKDFIETEASCRKQKLKIVYICHVQLIELMCNIYGVLYKNFVECPEFSKKSFDVECFFFFFFSLFMNF